jgi:ATP-dependent protease Clp ATPase subunit
MSTSTKRINWGGVGLGLLLMLAGTVTFVSGRLGSKFAYAEGAHVRVGAILMFTMGVWRAAQAFRKKKEPIKSSTAQRP